MPVVSQPNSNSLQNQASELYPKIIHRIIEGVSSDWLFTHDSYRREGDLPINLPAVLINRGYERLISGVLTKKAYHTARQVAECYLERKEFSKILELVENGQINKDQISLTDLFSRSLIGGATDSELTRCAGIIARNTDRFETEHSDLYSVLTTLWEAKKYGLAECIIKDFYPEGLQSCLIMQNRIRSGQQIELSDLEEIVQKMVAQLPVENRQGDSFFADRSVKQQIAALVAVFSNTLTDPHLILDAYDSANKILSASSTFRLEVSGGYERRLYLASQLIAEGNYQRALDVFQVDKQSYWEKKKIAQDIIVVAKANNDQLACYLGVVTLTDLMILWTLCRRHR